MKIHLGEFEAERSWENKEFAKLPIISDSSSNLIVDSMDEMLFGFSDKGDILVTKHLFNQSFKQYLYELGFDFKSYTSDSFFDQINVVNDEFTIEPYAITNYIQRIFEKYPDKLPRIDNVRNVNSKKFSTILSNKMMCNNSSSYIVESFSELQDAFELLSSRQIIIKEYFGVAGKGSLILKSDKSKNSIVKHIKRQADFGKRIGFVIEPYLKVQKNFSAHLYIDKMGKQKNITKRLMLNKHNSYNGSCRLEESREDFFLGNNYDNIISCIAHEVFQKGYWGNLCIDSLLQSNGDINPLVEINARKSMGLLQYTLEEQLGLCESGLYSILTSLELRLNNDMGFEDVLQILMDNNLLYSGKNHGIMPLSANTIIRSANNKKAKFRRGRLYFLAIADKEISICRLILCLRSSIERAGITIHG